MTANLRIRYMTAPNDSASTGWYAENNIAGFSFWSGPYATSWDATAAAGQLTKLSTVPDWVAGFLNRRTDVEMALRAPLQAQTKGQPVELLTAEQLNALADLLGIPDDFMPEQAARRRADALSAPFTGAEQPADPYAYMAAELFGDDSFLADVRKEAQRARVKFPSDGNPTTLALFEEAGEVAKAVLQEEPEAVYKEAVQLAAMALRLALEGDGTITAYRTKHGRKSLDGQP